MPKPKNKKNIRNRTRDMLGEYYFANRQMEKENQARQEQRKEWSKTELAFLIVTILGIIAIAVRYLILE